MRVEKTPTGERLVSTGSIAGQLLGAQLGEQAIPSRWLDGLELREEVVALADDLYAWFHDRRSRDAAEWWDRYPGC